MSTATAGSSLALLEPHIITGLGVAISNRVGRYWRKSDSSNDKDMVFLDGESKSAFTRFLVEKASEDSIYLRGEAGKYLTMYHKGGKIVMREQELFPTSKCELKWFLLEENWLLDLRKPVNSWVTIRMAKI